MPRTTPSSFRLAVTALAVALAAAACGGSGSPPGDTTVKWWAWNAGEHERTIAAFEKANPGIKVEFTAYSNADYLNNLRSALTSGKGPDVLQLAPGATVANYGDLVEDLGPLAEKQWGAGWRDRFNELGVDQLAANGRQAALPAYMSAAGLIYFNSGLLEKTGTKVPKDLAEWKAACKTIKAAGYDCLAHGAKDAWANLDVYLSLINSVKPGIVYDAIAGKADWTGPEFLQAMQAWRSLFTDGVISSGATAKAEYPDAFSPFLEGKAAFIALGTWNTPGTMTRTGLKVSQQTVSAPIKSVFLSAPFPGAATGLAPTGAFGGPDNGWAISSQSADRDAAWKLVSFLSDTEGQTIQAAVGNFPALLSVPVSTADVVDSSQVDDIERQQKTLTSLIGYRQIPYPDLETALARALSEVAAGTAEPAEALAAVQGVSSSLTR
ncbi:ABC transporter substrate-binding protein [Nonomuraea sp. KM88]|uniref:ABC transporter substrate-binding protein n=1 Tax=Nonomuraea sp. KM88 TaxID=3457427 RepID=UPI003FCD41B8